MHVRNVRCIFELLDVGCSSCFYSFLIQPKGCAVSMSATFPAFPGEDGDVNVEKDPGLKEDLESGKVPPGLVSSFVEVP